MLLSSRQAKPKVELDEKLVNQTLLKIKTQPPSADFFDSLQKQVCDCLCGLL